MARAVRLGTLELLTDEDVVGSPPANTIDSGKQGQGALFESSAVDPEVVQDVEERRIVMMNPPFTANDKKGRKFTPEVVKALQRRELQIRDRLAAATRSGGRHQHEQHQHDVHAAGGEGPGQDDGVLAKIMPVTACTGSSGLSERRFLASRFHIDMIVCSHDPREPNLSTHTAINECLLIATRDGRASRAATIFVNLRRFPKTVEAVPGCRGCDPESADRRGRQRLRVARGSRAGRGLVSGPVVRPRVGAGGANGTGITRNVSVKCRLRDRSTRAIRPR